MLSHDLSHDLSYAFWLVTEAHLDRSTLEIQCNIVLWVHEEVDECLTATT